MLETIFIVVATAVLTCFLLLVTVKKALPSILSDVAVGTGESISTKLNEVLANPNVKKAFTILGKQSGEVRADKALQNKAADALVSLSPVVKMGLEKIGLTPLEGMKLYNDPVFGPMIQSFIKNFQEPSGEGTKKTSSSQSQPGLM